MESCFAIEVLESFDIITPLLYKWIDPSSASKLYGNPLDEVFPEIMLKNNHPLPSLIEEDFPVDYVGRHRNRDTGNRYHFQAP